MPTFGATHSFPPINHTPAGATTSSGISLGPITSYIGNQDSVVNNPQVYLGFTVYDIEANPQANANTSFKYDAQAAPDFADLQALALAQQHTGVSSISTGSWIVQPVFSNLGMAVTVAPGSGKVNNVSVTTSTIVTLNVSASTQADRKDIIVYDSFVGGFVCVRGSECAGPGTAIWTRSAASPYPPVKPFLTNTQVLLAEVYVPYGLTAVTTSEIVDKRVATT